MTRFILAFALIAGLPTHAREVPPAAPMAPAEATIEADDGTRVAVLGYHEFSESASETAMRIKTSKFRKQMEVIRQLGIPVIGMKEFIAWKAGEKDLPPKSVLLTFDDGWKSVYTDAFPILKEFGYPFTLFLYKNYVDGGGKALTTSMIREMINGGATIGSHSVSHPYPATVKGFRKKGPEAFEAYLRKEMGDSKRFLESKFSVTAVTYSYPGGFFTEEMLPIAGEVGYTHLFTVQPGKVKRSTPNEAVPRYMILGNYDKIFEFATTFREAHGPSPAGSIAGLIQTTPYPVEPEPGSVISSRLPVISADLSKVADLDPSSLVMRVSGFGEVPASFASETGKLSWQVNRRLRHPTCQVSIHWKSADGKEPEAPLRWSFQIDREAAYLPDGD